jgi:hypothetical protein
MTILPESATWAGTTGELLLNERFIVAVLVDGGDQSGGNADGIIPPPTLHGRDRMQAVVRLIAERLPCAAQSGWGRDAGGHRSPVDRPYLQGRWASVK